ncbi:MAG: hypothetical protein JXN59_03810 [Anaerolineae bacterium]|nr:hypothetical protein [Anaerolineae bacterium]
MKASTRPGFSLRLAGSVVLGAVYAFFLRPQLLKWGTRLGESQRRLAGDEIIPSPNFVVTRAINIDAPPDAVWPWLAQMGRERTGWYSYDLLDNNGIPSATYLRNDLEPPRKGMQVDAGLQIVDSQPNRLLLLAGYDMSLPVGGVMDLTTLYQLDRMADGSTRLLVRSRAYTYGFAGRVFSFLFEPLDFLMGVKQLEGIKSRAETMMHLRIQPPVEHEISLN